MRIRCLLGEVSRLSARARRQGEKIHYSPCQEYVHRSVIDREANGVFKSINKCGERPKANNNKLRGKFDHQEGLVAKMTWNSVVGN